MALPALQYTQRDFSGGQITETAARRDDVQLQRAGLKRSQNTRILATGAAGQRFGRTAYRLDTGRVEQVRISDELDFEFVFATGALRIYDGHGDLENEITGLPWTLDTVKNIRMTQAEREVAIAFPGTRPYLMSYGLSATPAAGVGVPIGDMLDHSAFPTVAATNTGTQATPSTSHTINLPSGITVGDHLVAFAHFSSATGGETLPGWQPRGSGVFERIADGTEGATATLTTTNSVSSGHNTYRVSGSAGALELLSALSLDPPSLTTTWGIAKTLWLAALQTSRNADHSITGTPTSYTNAISAKWAASGTTRIIGSLRRQLAAASDDPSTFTTSTALDFVKSITVAIEPSSTLEQAFDGQTSKPAASCVQLEDDTHAYVGLNFSADPQRISSVTVYGSNNRGFIRDTDGTEEGVDSTVTLTLRGKNGSAPTSPSDGTSLGTTNFTDTANENAGRTITSSDTSTPYDYVWVQVAHDAAAARDILVAQLVISVFSATAAEQWSFQAFQFTETPQGAKRQPYVRYAPKGIAMTPAARTGSNIDVTFDQPVLDDAHENVSFRYHGRELVITEITSPTAGKMNVIEKLPPTMRVVCASANERDSFLVGQVAIGQTTGAEGLIVAFVSTASLDVIMDKGDSFVDTERIISSTGVATVTGIPTEQTVAASAVWDEAAMSDFRGWPRNVDYDRSRLIMCDFPQAPRGIAWSAVGVVRDFAVGVEGDDGFFEFAPGNGRVLHVQGGADQFVLTDQGVMYIPISESSPLQPGSVAFRPIAAVGASGIEPARMHEGLVYVSANNKSLHAIVPTGQTAFPYRVTNISQFHSDLFTGVLLLAAMSGGGTEAEQSLWVGQDDGSALVGKFDPSNEWVGFLPVTGDGLIKWISALGGTVHFATDYQSDPDFDWVLEHLDQSSYLDGAITLNDPDANLAGSGGQGPLWMYAGLVVELMDGIEYLGSRTVDSNGDLVELAGDDFSAATVMAGFAWTTRMIPYLPDQGEGEDAGQRRRRRRVAQAAAVVQDATKFTFMGRVFGTSAAQASGTYRAPGQMRSFAPTIELVKTEPGPITVTELNGKVVG